MKVILRPLGDARYEARRSGDVEALVWGTFWGWDVYAGGMPMYNKGEPVKHFRRVADARLWLDSDEGQAWLDHVASGDAL